MSMAAFPSLLALLLLALIIIAAYAYDPSPLQDFCVADPNPKVLVNGMACKDPKLVTPQNFFTSGLNTSNFPAPFPGSNYSAASVTEIPGLNTLGLTMVRNDYLPDTVIPPHTHPRATELSLVLKGAFYVGFVAADPTNSTRTRVYSKNCRVGDVFVVPQGLIHFGQVLGGEDATTISVLNSQSPGFNFVANQLFANDPPIPDVVLAKSFRVDNRVINQIKSHFP